VKSGSATHSTSRRVTSPLELTEGFSISSDIGLVPDGSSSM
jgi:hypothetical protein